MNPRAKGTASPLTPALSPLRGEGEPSDTGSVIDGLWRFVARHRARRRCFQLPNPAGASPSPLNGERAGVRGETVRSAPPLSGQFIASCDDRLIAHCGHEPAKGSPSPLNGERAGVRGETVRLAPSLS